MLSFVFYTWKILTCSHLLFTLFLLFLEYTAPLFPLFIASEKSKYNSLGLVGYLINMVPMFKIIQKYILKEVTPHSPAFPSHSESSNAGKQFYYLSFLWLFLQKEVNTHITAISPSPLHKVSIICETKRKKISIIQLGNHSINVHRNIPHSFYTSVITTLCSCTMDFFKCSVDIYIITNIFQIHIMLQLIYFSICLMYTLLYGSPWNCYFKWHIRIYFS